MAVGCSHGNRANQKAINAVLRFKERFKPHETIHLGDAFDLASLRSGSLSNSNDSDSADDYLDDIERGVEFLNQLKPTVFLLGNHDERAKKFLHHHNAVIRGYAEALWDRMLRPIKAHCHTFIDRYSAEVFYALGGYRWMHGVIYSENFLRDSAETYGNCVVAHAHKAGQATGRCLGSPQAFSPGTLADVPSMEYALRRRSTLSWSHGIVFGTYTDESCNLYVHRWPQSETKWSLPSFLD